MRRRPLLSLDLFATSVSAGILAGFGLFAWRIAPDYLIVQMTEAQHKALLEGDKCIAMALGQTFSEVASDYIEGGKKFNSRPLGLVQETYKPNGCEGKRAELQEGSLDYQVTMLVPSEALRNIHRETVRKKTGIDPHNPAARNTNHVYDVLEELAEMRLRFALWNEIPIAIEAAKQPDAPSYKVKLTKLKK